jgi:hypothetical protein
MEVGTSFYLQVICMHTIKFRKQIKKKIIKKKSMAYWHALSDDQYCPTSPLVYYFIDSAKQAKMTRKTFFVSQ